MEDELRYTKITDGLNFIRKEPSVRFFPMWNLDDIDAIAGLIEFGTELSNLGPNLVGVEIGTGFGESATVFTSFPCVHFLHSCDVIDRNPKRIEALMKTNKMHFHLCDSIRLSEEFDNNSLDFVYIDGNHSYENCLLDCLHWFDKVKPGGIVGGHDYIDVWPGVVQAVNELCVKYKLQIKKYRDHSWSVKKMH